MPKPFIAARIPEELDNAINEKCKADGIKRTDVLVQALRFYLVNPETSEDDSLRSEIFQIWKAINQIQKAVEVNNNLEITAKTPENITEDLDVKKETTKAVEVKEVENIPGSNSNQKKSRSI